MTTLALRSALSSILRLFVVGVTLVAAHALAQAPSAPPQDQIVSELIGARVFTAEGSEVGEVSAVSIGPRGEIS
jgi:ribosomal 30S subunit maturation factor RimM